MTTSTLETYREYSARLNAIYANLSDDGVYVDDSDEDGVDCVEKERLLEDMPEYF